MESKELMIGNWVLFAGTPSIVKGVLSNTNIEFENGFVSANLLEPIPLTPEILDFNISRDNEHYFLGHFGWCIIFDGEDWCIKQVINNNTITGYCRYLHQLQNWYYLITSTTLQINI